MSGNGSQVHHHSALAGVGAGTAAVLFAFGVLALAWHRVAGQVSMAVAVLAYAVMAAVAVAAAAGAFYVFLWVRHRVRNPELLAGRRTVQAQAVQAEPAAIPAREVPALPAPVHYHFDSAEAVQAALAAMRRDGEP